MNEGGITLRQGLMDRVDSRISTLQQRIQQQQQLRDLKTDYNETHVENSPFPPRYRPPPVLKRHVKSYQYNDYTISQKRQICLRTLAKHYVLQKEYEVLYYRMKALSPSKRGAPQQTAYHCEEYPNYRQLYADIKKQSVASAQLRKQAVKETEMKAVLVREQRKLQRQIEAYDVKALEAELRVLKMQYDAETALRTQQVRQNVSQWVEQSKMKAKLREQERLDEQEIEMEELVDNVIQKENEIRFLQEQIRDMKQKMGYSVQ